MDVYDYLIPGMFREQTFTVEEQHTASHVGSGTLRVLATPWMIAYMETTARIMLDEALPDTQSSVGVLVNVRHLAPSPQGSRVRVRVEVIDVDKNLVSLSVQAWDEEEQIGKGQHERVVIDVSQKRAEIRLQGGHIVYYGVRAPFWGGQYIVPVVGIDPAAWRRSGLTILEIVN